VSYQALCLISPQNLATTELGEWLGLIDLIGVTTIGLNAAERSRRVELGAKPALGGSRIAFERSLTDGRISENEGIPCYFSLDFFLKADIKCL
jgi:hypothetical protein